MKNMTDAQRVADNKRERHKVMAGRLAFHLGFSKSDRFEDAPVKVQAFLMSIRYNSLIGPLVKTDRANGLTYGQLEIKYGIYAADLHGIVNAPSLITEEQSE